MSEAAEVALIAGAFNVLAIVANRWLSHREHKETSLDVKAIKHSINGYGKGEKGED